MCAELGGSGGERSRWQRARPRSLAQFCLCGYRVASRPAARARSRMRAITWCGERCVRGWLAHHSYACVRACVRVLGALCASVCCGNACMGVPRVGQLAILLRVYYCYCRGGTWTSRVSHIAAAASCIGLPATRQRTAPVRGAPPLPLLYVGVGRVRRGVHHAICGERWGCVMYVPVRCGRLLG